MDYEKIVLSMPMQIDIAESIRDACIQAARESFQDAMMSGLCSDGAMEAAIGAIQSLDLEHIIHNRQNQVTK